jgi:hypothetical protein
MRTTPTTLFLCWLALLLASAPLSGRATPLAAQSTPLATRPFADWRTLETEHFAVHYPYEMTEWTLPLVARLEGIHAAVSTLVGNAPERRITVLVTDPYNLSNGSALPFLNAPAMVLWPTPPDPRSGIGHYGSWPELLAVHEYGHLAHLTFPARNPRQRLIWQLLPVELGPVVRRAPRWAIEGYATYLEGRLTGSGRPYGVFRPAVLREWALEGKLPTYRELSLSNAYLGGSMAYLVGSAFLEWLVEQHGEESLNHVWRRLSAVRSRSFSQAFSGVYGGTPEDLYARFTVEVTREALAAEARLDSAGIVQGETVQRRTWSTGDPALSPDGRHLALVLRSRDRPSRLVVWRTEEEPESDAEIRATERARRRDPLDVPAVEWQPRPKKALATLYPVDGRPHEAPRFLPDARLLLVTRSEPMGDGTFRPDLFLWQWDSGDLKRITHHAGIREADPSPAGRIAVGVRCLNGICDLVRIELEDGTVTPLHYGMPGLVFYRPRYSPNGRQIVVSVQEAGRWRVALTDETGEALRYIDPDDGASRYDASFLPDGRSVVLVSEAGGVPNLEAIDLESGAVRPLTRVTGAALAPDPDPADSSLYFLRLHAQGLDLNRIDPSAVTLDSVVALGPEYWPAAPARPTAPVDTFPIAPVMAPRPYGLGPTSLRLLPSATFAPQGYAGGVALARTDPVGRWSWLAQGTLGSEEMWSGAAASFAWRRYRPVVGGDVFWARQRPSGHAVVGDSLAPLDVDYYGTALRFERSRDWGLQRDRYRIGGTLGWLNGGALSHAPRNFVFAEYAGGLRQTHEGRYFAQSVALHGALGRTAGHGWRRLVATVGLGAGIRFTDVRTQVTYGSIGENAGAYELFRAGGVQPTLFDEAVLAQRLPMPALPLGTVSGAQILTARASVRVGTLRPYFWGASTDGAFQTWYRVVGVERELDVQTVPLLRIPQVHLLAGIGYVLDEPFKHSTRGYLSVGYRP